jgi:hypothetical protein
MKSHDVASINCQTLPLGTAATRARNKTGMRVGTRPDVVHSDAAQVLYEAPVTVAVTVAVAA